MTVYLTGPPRSTKKHPLSLDIAPQVAESRHLALVARSAALHNAASSGLSRSARGLKVRRHVVQLRETRRGGHVILVWLWLSDDTRYRVAWLLGRDEDRLCRTWQRIPWTELVFRSEAS
jgi:hypothetical protein